MDSLSVTIKPLWSIWKIPNREAWCLGLNVQFSLLLQPTVLDLSPIYEDINIRNKGTNIGLFHLLLFLFSGHQNIWLIAKHKMWVILLGNIIGIERSRYFNTKNYIVRNFATNVHTFVTVLELFMSMTYRYEIL